MVSVIYLGYYNKNGQFESDIWNAFIKWLSSRCDSIQIYTQLSYSDILNYFGDSGEVIQEEFPDKCLNYNSYKIMYQSNEFWIKIKSANFNIDNGITHLYFFYKEIYIAELETEDCENFVFLKISRIEECGLVAIIPEVSKNIKNCYARKEQIDYLVNFTEWRPIGVL